MDEKEKDLTPEEALSEAILTPDAPEGETPKKKKKKGLRILLIVVCSILALALLLLVVGTVMVYRWLGMINRTDGYLPPMSDAEMQAYLEANTDPYDPNYTGEVIDPDDVDWGDGTGILHSEHVVNILLIGSDTRNPKARGRTDSMILCSYNRKNNTLVMTSLLRDMYVQIPGYQDNRLNASYVFGGMKLLDKTIETNLGVRIDGNFVIEFEGFADVIDIVGGVDITLTQAEAEYMNTYAIGSKMKGQFKEGPVRLGGDDALTYARMRKIDSDFGRSQRQRTVMLAAYKECKNLSLTQLYQLMDRILPLMTTDMSNSEIMGYAAELLPNLTRLKVETCRIPADGAYRNAKVRNMYVLMPDLEANRRLLAEILAE